MSNKIVATWVKCRGAAHDPDNWSDYCGGCMPYWLYYPVCPKHQMKILNKVTGYCKAGRHYVGVPQNTYA